ncbi:RNA-directed DNA polymerase, eukaryota [Tanacetum coccineum]
MSRDESIFVYNPDVLRKQFASLAIQRGLPFNHFDDKQTTRVFQNHLQPRYTHVSRTTLKRDAMKLWVMAKQANEAIPLSDEEIALDAASSEGFMSGPGSGGEEDEDEAEANYGFRGSADLGVGDVIGFIVASPRLAGGSWVFVCGEWIEDPPKVKNEFLEHFSNRFSMPTGQTINLDSHMFQKISIDQNADLESDVSLEEIKKAVWECGTNKSPGPDGFSFEFIRKYWNIIQHDVVNAVKEFFSSSKFPPGSNSSFITLIPKSLDAKMVKDFRPISLIGSFYKIVAKILSNRLCIVMPDLISDVQTAFISKRQILDGPFILNELISWCKYHKIKAMIFKADFEKAFDSVRWDYLDGVLNNFGFGVKWRGWIQACLSSAMGSILVNGSPSSEFKFHKGLKQGDPLSPFLFILVMESLHISFNNILNSGLYKGIRIDESLTLSHLFYADDAVFLGKWDKTNVITIVNMLKCFYLAPGLKINIQKSKIMGIGTSQEEVDVAANVIGCNTFSSPFNYLGVKVGSSSSRSNFWDEVIAKL